MKLNDYIIYWYQTYRMHHQQKNTQTAFISLINNHILTSPLANMELNDITARDCQEFLTKEHIHGCKVKLKNHSRVGQPLSAHSILKMRQILIAMFKQAAKEGLINKNVAEDTESVPLPWHDNPVFTPESQHKFLQAVKHHRFYAAYVLMFYLGCRRSEILGLSWDSIDFRRNLLRIRQVLIIENNAITLREQTKTKASIRTIPFPKEIKYILQEWRERQKKESKLVGYCNKWNLVFTNKDGSPHNPAYFSRNFKTAIRKLDFCANDLHIHSIRHTWATNMIQCGIPISDVQAIGGWSRPDTLLNIYSHTVKESQRKAMKKLFNEVKL